MRVMILLKSDARTESGVMPEPGMFEAMGRYNEELVNAGMMLAGEGLHPSSAGKRVIFDGDKRTVIDGPFAEAKELIAGFWIWKVDSMEQAVEWVKRAPFPPGGRTELEIRRIFDAEDFGEALPDSVREQEKELRARAEQLSRQS